MKFASIVMKGAMRVVRVRGRDQRSPGGERIEVTFRHRGAAVAATNGAPAGGICNRRVAIYGRELNARGWVAPRRQGRDEPAPRGCEAPVCTRSTAGGGWV